jgi:hypothetical protein
MGSTYNPLQHVWAPVCRHSHGTVLYVYALSISNTHVEARPVLMDGKHLRDQGHNRRQSITSNQLSQPLTHAKGAISL